MKARIKKWVWSDGDRLFDVVTQGEYANGCKWVDLAWIKLTHHKASGKVTESRTSHRYYLEDVELIDTAP